MVFHNFAKKGNILENGIFFKQRINRQPKHTTYNNRISITGNLYVTNKPKTFHNTFIKRTPQT